MSEPMSGEERARLREWSETSAHPWPTDRWECVEVGMTALLDDVDRLTEALEQAAKERTQLSGIAEAADRRWLDTLKRAERAEADLADEKRRHAECDEAKERYHEQWMLTEAELKELRAGVEAGGDYAPCDEPCRHSECEVGRWVRALLSDATTGEPDG